MSTKSWDAAGRAVMLAQQCKVKFMCCRQFQSKIAESVYTLIKGQIERFGLSDDFHITNTSIKHKHTGSEFIFYGIARNFDEIKSTEGVDILWIEEAHALTKAQWTDLDPTIRKDGSEIWIVYNPQLLGDFVHQNFYINPMKNSVVRMINYDENPFLNKTNLDVIHDLKETDYELYLHVYEGQTIQHSDDQILYGKWRVAEFEADWDWDGPYYGLDFGFSNDPTAATESWIHDNTLYIRREAGRVGLEIDETAAYLVERMPRINEHVVRADCARPESISYLKRHGLPQCVAAAKWPGSIVDSIAFMRSFKEIVIHHECEQVAFEAVHYKYKRNKGGDITTEIIGKHDHYLDSVKYSLAPLIKRGDDIFIG